MTLKNDALNEIRKKNPNRIIIIHLTINLIRKKSETKLDDTFPLIQFILEGFPPPYRLDKTERGGGLMLFVREDIPSKLLPNVNLVVTENIFVEINLKLKKCLKSSSYNPIISLIQIHTVSLNKQKKQKSEIEGHIQFVGV